MESEKIKEIKESLQDEIFIATSFDDKLRRVETKNLQDYLALINELESENERLQKECAGIADDYQEMGKFYYEEVEKNQQLNDRIVKLEKENTSLYDSYHKGYKVGYEHGKQDALTAEKAIESENSEITKSESNLAKTIYQELIELSEDPAMTREEIYEKVFSKYGINVEV